MKFNKIHLLISVLMLTLTVNSFPVTFNPNHESEVEQSSDEEEENLMKRFPSARMTFDVPDPEELYEDNPFAVKKRAINNDESESELELQEVEQNDDDDDDDEDEDVENLLKRYPSARMTFDVPDPEELYEDNPFAAKKRAINNDESELELQEVEQNDDDDDEDENVENLLKRYPSARMTFDVPDPEELYEDNPFATKKRGRVLGGHLSNIGQNYVMENVHFQDINEESDDD